MSRWRIVLTGIRKSPRSKRDTPKTRYWACIRSGSSPLGAARLTADSYGLPMYELDDDGKPIPDRALTWTLREIEHLLFVRHLADRGLIGGPNCAPIGGPDH